MNYSDIKKMEKDVEMEFMEKNFIIMSVHLITGEMNIKELKSNLKFNWKYIEKLIKNNLNAFELKRNENDEIYISLTESGMIKLKKSLLRIDSLRNKLY